MPSQAVSLANIELFVLNSNGSVISMTGIQILSENCFRVKSLLKSFQSFQGTTLVLALVRLDSSRKLALGLMQQLILVRCNPSSFKHPKIV